MSVECRACNETFRNITNFERHRVGIHTNQGPDYGRRCLSPDEMKADGMRMIDGAWRGEALPDDVLRRISGKSAA